MWKSWLTILAAALTMAACAMPAQPDPRSVRIESTPGVAVIYVVRSNPDIGPLPAQLVLNDWPFCATYPGTYVRLEVPAGRHRITGYGHDNGAITLQTQADRVYFVQQQVGGNWRANSPHSFFHLIDEARARAAMAGAQRMG
jgi:hypothetical protein